MTDIRKSDAQLDADRAAFKRAEWERIADLHPGVKELIEAEKRAERLAVVERIRKRLHGTAQAEIDFFYSLDVYDILDEEGQ